MDIQGITSVLTSVDLFTGLSPRVLTRIAESGRVTEFPAGADIVAAGAPVSGFRAFSPQGVEMHVILTGAATVQVGGKVVATLTAGDYFGELALIDGKPRSADVSAGDSGLMTFALPKWEFDSLVKDHPEVALPMLRVVVARLRRAEAAGR